MDVILVGLGNDLGEMRTLIASAGYHIAEEFVQRRFRPDTRTFVGKGKLEELRRVVERTPVQAVVFAGELRPSQHYELEHALKVQCFDRLRVILEIFTQRAHGREAKLQVELAMLQYEVPILKEWIHSASKGERPGFMAGGEYRVDAYHETVKRKMKRVHDDLEAVRKERTLRRDHRQRRGFHHLSIAGYANAGKSSLFNTLSGETVQVEDRLFTTLSTTTRALKGIRKPILLTDTVGLVSNVPLWLVEAFHSTFEEVYASDLVLLLVDVSDQEDAVREKVRLAAATLLSGMESARVQPVLSKTDLADEATLLRCQNILRDSEFVRPPVAISVHSGEGLDVLLSTILDEFRFPMEMKVCVSPGSESESLVSWLHDKVDVISVEYGNRGAIIQLRCQERQISGIAARSEVLSGPTRITSD